MNRRLYERITSLVFALVACGHLVRLIGHVEVHAAGWAVPMWFSVGGLLGAGFLSVWGFAAARR